MDFVAMQARAWSQVVGDMLKDPRNAVLNGSVNGPGSSLKFTAGLREQLPPLLKRYRVTTMLDAPCGDMTWISHTDLSFLYSYIGMDVEPQLIAAHKHNWPNHPRYTFVCANLLTRRQLPRVDLILCRDFLAHLTNDYIQLMLDKFAFSGSTYLLASNYPGASNRFKYVPENYPYLGYLERPHDLTADPFDLVRIDGIEEQPAIAGVIARQHELALFELQA